MRLDVRQENRSSPPVLAERHKWGVTVRQVNSSPLLLTEFAELVGWCCEPRQPQRIISGLPD